MTIDEIITNPPRDEYIDQYSSQLYNSPIVAKIDELNLHKKQSTTEIEYGLFNKDKLVGYFSLEYFGKNNLLHH